jgi:hypothetical protein
MKKDNKTSANLIPAAAAVASAAGAVTALVFTAVKEYALKERALKERSPKEQAPGETPIPDTTLDEADTAPAPMTVTYTHSGRVGYATGKVTVTLDMPPEKLADLRLLMYWGDENGKLPGYTHLPIRKVQGAVTDYAFEENQLIPAGATRLLVYLTDGEGHVSEDCVTLELPEGAAHNTPDAAKAQLWVMSDVHLTVDQTHTHNRNFASMLENAKAISPDALGLFVVGDMANSGQEQEYQNMMALHAEAVDAPHLFLTIGNHDFYNNSFEEGRAKFLRYATLPDGTHPETATYDFWLGGYHFISLCTDEPDGLDAIFHQSTMDWLREKLEEDKDPKRPTFLFLHQSMDNTVSGSLPGEGWSGVKTQDMLREVLKDHPEVMFFNGHSHWTMDSPANMFNGTPELPCRIFNCASVGYLWNGINHVGGEHLDGSQGYFVSICDGVLYVRGRDFCTNEWVAGAQYRIEV